MFKIRVQYRTLQCLGILFNEILQKVIVTAVVVCTIVFQAFCSAILISPRDSQKGWIEMGFMILMIVNSVAVLLLLMGGLAGVYVMSNDVLEIAMRHTLVPVKNCRRSRKIDVRFLRSCQCIKVGLGDLNFVDKTTPLNCIDFSNALTLQLLLLQKGV